MTKDIVIGKQTRGVGVFEGKRWWIICSQAHKTEKVPQEEVVWDDRRN